MKFYTTRLLFNHVQDTIKHVIPVWKDKLGITCATTDISFQDLKDLLVKANRIPKYVKAVRYTAMVRCAVLGNIVEQDIGCYY